MKRVPKVEQNPKPDHTIRYDHFKSVDFLLILIFGGLVVIATINHPLRDPRPVNPTCELR
jgi:hypothetical protein